MKNVGQLIQGGAFLMARKVFTSAVWQKNPLYLKFLIWCIGRASYIDHEANGFEYPRGEFVTTYDKIRKAMMFIRNRKRIFPTKKAISFMLKWFENEGIISVKPLKSEHGQTGGDTTDATRDYIGIKIIVINYNSYQDLESYKGGHKGEHLSEQGHNNNKGSNKKGNKTSSEISEKISCLKSRYPDQKIVNQALDAIASTRKTKRITDGVKLSILETWNRHPVKNVLCGIKTYLEKGYAVQGKKENYLLGIIRNTKDNSKPPPPLVPGGARPQPREITPENIGALYAN